jgi:transportin-3
VALLTDGQITYDLSTQVPPDQLETLRNELLVLLTTFAPGPRPIRVALSVCLAVLAIQMLAWKDVFQVVGSALGASPATHASLLDFLRVLPEEVTEGRKIPLSVRGSS